MTTAYPLKWPEGWPRSSIRVDRAPFKLTLFQALQRLYHELELMGAEHVVVSSWLPLRIDGQPRSDAARSPLADPGVAVYFTLDNRALVMARDIYRNVADNLISILHAVNHLRMLERHGGSFMMQRAFTGFVALSDKPHFRNLLGKGDLPDLERKYRALAKAANGDHDLMVELNLAIEAARKELSHGQETGSAGD